MITDLTAEHPKRHCGGLRAYAYKRHVPAVLTISRTAASRAGLQVRMRWQPWGLLSHHGDIHGLLRWEATWGFRGGVQALWGKGHRQDEDSRLHGVHCLRRHEPDSDRAGICLCGDMMRLIHTPDNIFADGELYLKIYVYGLTFLFSIMYVPGHIYSPGDSRTPLYFSSVRPGKYRAGLLVCSLAGPGSGGSGMGYFYCPGVSAILALGMARRLGRP